MRPQDGPANLPLGKCPPEAPRSGNAAAEAEARLKGGSARCSDQRRASWANFPDPPTRSFRGYGAPDLDQRFAIVFEAEQVSDFC
jgi:hypothetical protein